MKSASGSVMKLWHYLLLFFLTAVPSLLYAQSGFEAEGIPYIQNFTPEEYDFGIQNWYITQDSSGIVYIGNLTGLLVYDGERWESRSVPNNTISSLDTGSNTIYMGGYSELGFFEPDSIGRLTYHSLTDRVPEACQPVGNVVNTKVLENDVAFQSKNHILIWDGEGMECTSTETEFSFVRHSESDFYVLENDKGLHTVKDGELHPVDSSTPFGQMTHSIFFPGGRSDTTLISVWEDGFYRYDGQKVEKLDHTIGPDHDIYGGTPLNEQLNVMASLYEGLILADLSGAERGRIDESHGLIDQTVLYTYRDHEKNIWAATNNGLSYLEFHSPFRKYDSRVGLRGTVYCAIVHGDRLYAGTSRGLFSAGGSEVPVRFRQEAIGEESVYALESIGNNLLVGTSNGITVLGEDGAFTEIMDEGIPVNKFYRSSENPDGIFMANTEGVYYLNETEGEIQPGVKLSGIEEDINSIAEDRNGHLWLGTDSRGVIEITDWGRLSGTDASPSGYIERYEPEISDDNREVYVYRIDGDVRFASVKGLQRFDRIGKTFVPDSSFGEELADTTRQVFRMREDSAGNIWVRTNGNQQVLKKEGEGRYDFQEIPLKRLSDNLISHIYADDNGKIWYSGSDGLYSYDSTFPKEYDIDYKTHIRKVLVRGDSLIFGGHHPETPVAPELEYSDNELRFQYAAASYEASDSLRYQFKLDGFDDGWSTWTDESQKDYTNIPEGSYTFNVRARNVYGAVSSTDRFSFTVVPPWYRSSIAYIGYIFIVGGVFYGLHKIRVNRILKEQRIRNKIADDLHDEVSATLSSITYFAEAIRQSGEEDNHNRFVRLISDSASEAKEKITDIIWSIDPENDDWVNMLAKCRRFASDLLESKDIEYHLDIDTDIPKPLDLELRQHLWLIFKEMLTNAARHSEADRVTVLYTYRNGKLILEIADNGSGFDSSGRMHGKGIKNIRRRAEEIGARLTLDTGPGMGTCWELSLKL